MRGREREWYEHNALLMAAAAVRTILSAAVALSLLRGARGVGSILSALRQR